MAEKCSYAVPRRCFQVLVTAEDMAVLRVHACNPSSFHSSERAVLESSFMHSPLVLVFARAWATLFSFCTAKHFLPTPDCLQLHFSWPLAMIQLPTLNLAGKFNGQKQQQDCGMCWQATIACSN